MIKRSDKLDFYNLHKWKKNSVSQFIKETDFSISQVSRLTGYWSDLDVKYYLHLDQSEIRPSEIRLFQLLNYIVMFCGGSGNVKEIVRGFLDYEKSLIDPPF